MTWNKKINPASLSWLLEEENPGVRYLALRDLLESSDADPELIAAREKSHRDGPIAKILDAMKPEGYWVTPGAGYSCKYKSGVWSLIMLAQLGASVEMDERLQLACRYLIDHALAETGQFSTDRTPSGTIDCLQGNLVSALLDLGYQDNRMELAIDWMVRSVTGDGIAPLTDKKATVHYFPWNCGPVFACRYNGSLPCAWGGTKVLLALGKIPSEKQTPQVESAIETAVDFFLSIDPLKADFPTRTGSKPSPDWWKFGFPVFYGTDILQLAEALVRVGLGDDPRLTNTLVYIRDKQDEKGQWVLENDYKTWVRFGPLNQPNKWVTYRALKVLRNSVINQNTKNGQ
ncbi:MAG: nitrogen fixation protein NifH [Chloroflexi bacterium HGW-Chloroflexi-3]|nr:MAG: nitrogen fixation protein NifH [Chloroflexi bacterium HGW-Chloroflexi-3]